MQLVYFGRLIGWVDGLVGAGSAATSGSAAENNPPKKEESAEPTPTSNPFDSLEDAEE